MLKFRNILRKIREYFSPNPNQMLLSSKVETLRDELLKNCQYAIKLLETSKLCVTTAYSSVENFLKFPIESTDPSTSSIKDQVIAHQITDVEMINKFMVQTHGVLEQEWEHFLYDIFTEGVVYYVKGYDLADIRHKFSLENFNPIVTIEEMREKISAELERALLKYETLFKESRSLFKIDEPDLLKEMQKQARVRHIFQHNKGKIRRLDLDAIGSIGPDACIYILDEEGKSQPYKENKEIWLSLPEIQRLYETIEQYSEKFQIKAEMAQPIKATNSSVKKPEVNT